MDQAFRLFSNFAPNRFSGRANQLNDFVNRRQLALLDAGDEGRAHLDTVEKVKAHADTMRKTFLEKLGGIPPRDCPPDPVTTKVTDRGDFTLEAVVFKSGKGCYVTGSWYFPKGLTEPSAAVLFMCGHSANGRMHERYQSICQMLVRAGLIVFAVDPPGQGERITFYDRKTDTYFFRDAVDDHDLCGIPSMATGQFLEAYFLRDQMAAVDYMLTRPEVDSARIGMTGCSGGGTQTVTMMICDDRIAAAAPVCFTSTRREILSTNQTQDAEQIWPGCAAYGFDHFEPFIMFAPKPVVILANSADFFPVEGAFEVYDYMKVIYGLYGKEENMNISVANSCHGYAFEHGVTAAAFFCKVFGLPVKGDLTYKPFPDGEMYATRTGNVLGDFDDALTIPDITAAQAEVLRLNRKREQAKDWLTERVEYARIPYKPWLKLTETANVNGYYGKGAVWWVQKELAAFGVLIAKGNRICDPAAPVVIALWDNGTRVIAEHGEWIKSRCDEGRQVLVVDLPGNGALVQTQLWHYKGTLYKMCYDLIYMDDSMAAMQTYNLLRTVDMLRDSLGVTDVTFYCEGSEGSYGILAGYLAGLPREYSETLLTGVEDQIIAARPRYHDNNLRYIIPGMLKYFDFDELM